MTSRRYTKDDVDQHSDGYGPRRPAVNVKTSPWEFNTHLRDAAEENGYNPEDFQEWAEQQSDDFWDDYFRFACETGWEDLQSDAEYIFGDHIKVTSEGRSGGWAVVDGLPDVEDWDAIQLSKWRKFEKWARSIADAIPESMAVLATINAYAWHVEQKEACERSWSEALLRSVGVLT